MRVNRVFHLPNAYDRFAETKEISDKLKNSYNWSDTNFEDYLQNLDETGQFEGGKEKRHIRQRFKKTAQIGKIRPWKF